MGGGAANSCAHPELRSGPGQAVAGWVPPELHNAALWCRCAAGCPADPAGLLAASLPRFRLVQAVLLELVQAVLELVQAERPADQGSAAASCRQVLLTSGPEGPVAVLPLLLPHWLRCQLQAGEGTLLHSKAEPEAHSGRVCSSRTWLIRPDSSNLIQLTNPHLGRARSSSREPGCGVSSRTVQG